MRHWINSLTQSGAIPREGYRALLSGEADAELREAAESVTLREFGGGIYVRALIEITNRCRNNCYYCGIRASNSEIERYTLSKETILESCEVAHSLGFRTFVLQGGENPAMSERWIEEVVGAIHERFSDCAITLSIGELSDDSYQRLFEAGASRYLLRHESYNREHYEMLHPHTMSYDNRHRALGSLQSIGYQVGCGMMVGSPYQSVEHLVEDLLFIERFKPQMVGIGPFIPHHATPFADQEAGSIDMTLRLISIVRLQNPRILIPSTTALATLCGDGHRRGILAGANVVMPNVTPARLREEYSLYDNKASFGAESAEGLNLLAESLRGIGREINFDRGDYRD